MDENGLLLKFLGAVAGTVLSLVFKPPKTMAEFRNRSVFSLFSGLLFSGPVRDYLHWIPTAETEVASGALTAMMAWAAMNAVTRFIDKWKGPSK